MAKPHIHVWRFEDAPEDFKRLSTHGGDEDWLAVVPDEYAGTYIPWLESGGPFGVCRVEEYNHPYVPGAKVYIGAHA